MPTKKIPSIRFGLHNTLLTASLKWMVGAWDRYPGACTVTTQPLRQNTAPVAGKSPQPSHEPPFQAPITLMKQWKEETQGMEGVKMLKQLLNRPLHKCSMNNSKILG